MNRYCLFISLLFFSFPLCLHSQSLYLEKNNGLSVIGSFNRLDEGDGFSIQSGIGDKGSFDFGFSYSYQEYLLKELLVIRNDDSTNPETIRAYYNTTNLGFYFRFFPLRQYSISNYVTFSIEGAMHNHSRGFISDGYQYFQGGFSLATKIKYSYESRFIPHISWVSRLNLKGVADELYFFTYGLSFTYKYVNRDMILIDLTHTKEQDYSLVSVSVGYLFDFGHGM